MNYICFSVQCLTICAPIATTLRIYRVLGFQIVSKAYLSSRKNIFARFIKNIIYAKHYPVI